MRTRLTALLALLTAVLLGSVGLAPAHADPAVPVTGTVVITPSSQYVGGVWTSSVTTAPTDASRDGYQWLRDGEPIAGATAPTYTATLDDAEHYLSLEVRVSATGMLPATLTSEESDEVEVDELDTFDAYRPLVTGKVRVGHTVRVETDADDYDETTTLAYQWMLGGKPAGKGTAATFRLKKKHRGMVLTVQVTASAPGFETETVTSRPKKVKR